MSKVIPDLLEGKTLLNKVACTGVAQRVWSHVRCGDPNLEHVSLGQTIKAAT